MNYDDLVELVEASANAPDATSRWLPYPAKGLWVYRADVQLNFERGATTPPTGTWGVFGTVTTYDYRLTYSGAAVYPVEVLEFDLNGKTVRMPIPASGSRGILHLIGLDLAIGQILTADADAFSQAIQLGNISTG